MLIVNKLVFTMRKHEINKRKKAAQRRKSLTKKPINVRLCSVGGCVQSRFANGFCEAHYYKFTSKNDLFGLGKNS